MSSSQGKNSSDFNWSHPYQAFIFKQTFFIKSFEMSPRMDIIMNFFPINKKQHVTVGFKNRKERSLEMVFTYIFDFEVVEVELPSWV